jgi:hypothetical protein
LYKPDRKTKSKNERDDDRPKFQGQSRIASSLGSTFTLDGAPQIFAARTISFVDDPHHGISALHVLSNYSSPAFIIKFNSRSFSLLL